MAIPFFLYRTGSTAGVTPVPPETGGVGSSISGGTFSRGRWHALKSEWAAQRLLHARAQSRKRRKECEALEEAADEAASALRAAEDVQATATAEIAKLVRTIEAATAATTLKTIIARCNATNRAAAELKAAILHELEMQDEDEAIMLLLLH